MANYQNIVPNSVTSMRKSYFHFIYPLFARCLSLPFSKESGLAACTHDTLANASPPLIDLRVAPLSLDASARTALRLQKGGLVKCELWLTMRAIARLFATAWRYRATPDDRRPPVVVFNDVTTSFRSLLSLIRSNLEVIYCSEYPGLKRFFYGKC